VELQNLERTGLWLVAPSTHPQGPSLHDGAERAKWLARAPVVIDHGSTHGARQTVFWSDAIWKA
jgi:hypothetical protein